MRLYELAKQLDVAAKRLLDEARKAGLPLTNPANAVTSEQEAFFRKVIGASAVVGKPVAAAKPTAVKPAAKPAPARKVKTVKPITPPAPPPPPRQLIQAKNIPGPIPGPVGAKPVPPTPVGVKPVPPTPVGVKPVPPTPVSAKPVPPTPVGVKPPFPTDEMEEGKPGDIRKIKRRVKGPRPGALEDKPLDLLLEEVEEEAEPILPLTGMGRRPTAVASRYDRNRGRGRSSRGGAPRRRAATPPAAFAKEATVELPITIKAFSNLVGIRGNDIISMLLRHNILANINAPLTADMIAMIAKESGVALTVREGASLEQKFEAEMKGEEQDRPEELKLRAPIVTFMGHVDHGKTSLLDRIRNANVAAGESGGITQHIGAYRANVHGKYVTFLDTPGHEAFTAMRARGANVTDVVVLVVAADDGVMPQTEEALDHARAAGVPIIVAVNKIDKPEAKPERVRTQLAEKGLMPEEWGGDTVFVDVSAVTGKGVDDMLEMLALVAELQDLKANTQKRARGTVLETRVSKSRGTAATLLVREGTLRKGDIVLCGASYGKVKAIYDDRGNAIDEAGPSVPVEVLGLSEAPGSGEAFFVVESPQRAKEIADSRRQIARQAELARPKHTSLESLYADIEAGKTKELRLIVKTDVKGSIEALLGVLDALPKTEVKLRVLRSSVGNVASSDVLLADASDAIIIGLHIGVDTPARLLADRSGVELRLYEVIYHVSDDIRKALEGLLEPDIKEKVIGHAQVRQVLKVSRVGLVAGCYVTDGFIQRSATVRLLRDQGIAHTGPLESLKRFKDDVREVREGFECGLRLAGYDDIKAGDVLEAFVTEEIKPTLESRAGGQVGEPAPPK